MAVSPYLSIKLYIYRHWLMDTPNCGRSREAPYSDFKSSTTYFLNYQSSSTDCDGHRIVPFIPSPSSLVACSLVRRRRILWPICLSFSNSPTDPNRLSSALWAAFQR